MMAVTVLSEVIREKRKLRNPEIMSVYSDMSFVTKWK